MTQIQETLTQTLPRRDDAQRPSQRMPWAGLLVLAMAGFITILTEALPAGLLPQMGADLEVSEALVGQLVTMYAIGSLVAAIPLVAITQRMRRLPLLCIAIGGFAVVNLVTALSHDYVLTLIARFFAGVFAGLLWALVAGHASRMVSEQMRGRAIAITMVGTPLALSIGIPAGTALGALLGWRVTFGIMTLLTVILVFCARAKVPDFPGSVGSKGNSIRSILTLPGIRAVLFVALVFVLAHNILYTYIAPLLRPAGLSEHVDAVLLAFGLAALAGIGITGILIDRWARELVLACIVLFALSAFVLGIWYDHPLLWFVASGVWGLSFGGAPALLQTALARAAGNDADVAQSMFVTVWNIGIAGGGIGGGLLLGLPGDGVLQWTVVLFLIPTFCAAVKVRKAGFPPVES